MSLRLFGKAFRNSLNQQVRGSYTALSSNYQNGDCPAKSQVEWSNKNLANYDKPEVVAEVAPHRLPIDKVVDLWIKLGVANVVKEHGEIVDEEEAAQRVRIHEPLHLVQRIEKDKTFVFSDRRACVCHGADT